MKRILLAVCLVVLVSVSAFAGESIADFPPVLLYYDIKDKPLNEADVTVEDFCAQLDWLKENGYETLSIEDFVSYVKRGESFPEKSILITFDNGYSGIFNYAFPEMTKRGMKATLFINTEYVGSFTTVYAHITKRQIKQLVNTGLFSVASDTASFPRLTQITHEERQKELAKSKKFLEDLTGKKVEALAYPYSDYDGKVIDDVKEAGYEVAFAVENKGLFGHDARYSIPRIVTGMALGEDNQKLFKELVLNYKEMSPEAFADRWKPMPGEEWRWEPKGE